MKNFPKIVFFYIFTFLFFCSVNGQEDNIWRGKIINGETGEAVPNAVIAVYRTMVMYAADIEGIVKIRLQENDSVRVVALGYSAKTFRIKELQINDDEFAVMHIYSVSYMIKEVTVRGQKGLLNSHIFPKLKDDSPSINMHLPGDIGSKINDLHPSERLLCEQPSILTFLINPVTTIYSIFSNEKAQLEKLRKARFDYQNAERLNSFISPEAIAKISGYEGIELEKFIVFCNINLKINQFDNGASISAKIEEIFKMYLSEKQQTNH